MDDRGEKIALLFLKSSDFFQSKHSYFGQLISYRTASHLSVGKEHTLITWCHMTGFPLLTLPDVYINSWRRYSRIWGSRNYEVPVWFLKDYHFWSLCKVQKQSLCLKNRPVHIATEIDCLETRESFERNERRIHTAVKTRLPSKAKRNSETMASPLFRPEQRVPMLL